MADDARAEIITRPAGTADAGAARPLRPSRRVGPLSFLRCLQHPRCHGFCFHVTTRDAPTSAEAPGGVRNVVVTPPAGLRKSVALGRRSFSSADNRRMLPWRDLAPDPAPRCLAAPRRDVCPGGGLQTDDPKPTERGRSFRVTLCGEVKCILTNFVSNLLTIC